MTGQDVTRAEVWTKRVAAGGAEALMEHVLRDAAASGSEVIVLDASMVFGADHISSALAHALKATSEGRNASDSLAMETLLYASGERQLSAATMKMGVGPETSEVVVAAVSGSFSPGPGWARLPEAEPTPGRERLAGFGITEKEMSTVNPECLSELVLERVAAVDVLKK